MQKTAKLSSGALALKIEDFGVMQERYQALPFPARASVILGDAKPALAVATQLLETLAASPFVPKAIALIRSNPMIVGRMRASEAKTVLMDEEANFLQVTRQKLAAWSKTLHRIADGQEKVTVLKESITDHRALAVAGITNISNYLAMVKLIVPELAKLDPAREQEYSSMLVEIRRCATLLSDCECASGLNSVVFH